MCLVLPTTGWIDIRTNMSKIKKYYYSFEEPKLVLYKEEDMKKEMFKVDLQSAILCYVRY